MLSESWFNLKPGLFFIENKEKNLMSSVVEIIAATAEPLRSSTPTVFKLTLGINSKCQYPHWLHSAIINTTESKGTRSYHQET